MCSQLQNVPTENKLRRSSISIWDWPSFKVSLHYILHTYVARPCACSLNWLLFDAARREPNENISNNHHQHNRNNRYASLRAPPSIRTRKCHPSRALSCRFYYLPRYRRRPPHPTRGSPAISPPDLCLPGPPQPAGGPPPAFAVPGLPFSDLVPVVLFKEAGRTKVRTAER